MGFIYRNLNGVKVPKEHYSYTQYIETCKKLCHCYPEIITYKKIGSSHNGRDIVLLSIGKGKRKIHINGTHHGNEWITTLILLKSIEILCHMAKHQIKIYDKNCKEWLEEEVCFDFVPLVNPDGMELVLNGVDDETQFRSELMNLNNNSTDFRRWKANIRGVDLNRNYDAGFKEYQELSPIKTPYYEGFCGTHPGSEPETKALIELTNKKLYDMVLAYHTQGEEIYWKYDAIQVRKAKAYALKFNKVSGYKLSTPDDLATGCGYKDWFIKCFRMPGYTIECGKGFNPISMMQFDKILQQTFPILIVAGISL